MTPLEFHQVVMDLATKYDFSETSGHRSRKRNAAVGGNVNSRHLSYRARDVVLDDLIETDAFIADARRAGIVAVLESDHIHLQTN